MSVEGVRPTGVGLIDTPRPEVTQLVSAGSRQRHREPRKSFWEKVLVAVGVAGLIGTTPWPVFTSLIAHGAAIVLLAAGGIGFANRPGEAPAEIIEVDTTVAPGDPAFDSLPPAAVEEPLLREPPAGPLAAGDPDLMRSMEELSSGPRSREGGGASEDFFEGQGGSANHGADGIGAGGGGGLGSVELFGAHDEGRRFLYVIDRSFSMTTNDAWRAAVTELVTSLGKLTPGMEFQVVFYSDDPFVLDLPGRDERMVSVNEKNLAAARDEIREMKPQGGTNHKKALQRALKLRPDIIFLLTDAEDIDNAVIRELTRENQKRGGPKAKIHVILFHHETGRAPNDMIKRLADANHGSFRVIDTTGFKSEN